MARLAALMGEGRCGSPAPVDTWQPGAFAMQPFAPRESNVIHPHDPRRHEDTSTKKVADIRAVANGLTAALRRFRVPVPARIKVEDGRPARLTIDRRGFSSGRVTTSAGPWRASGAWWREEPWDRDEWDVALHDGTTYRVFRERDADRWFVEGVVD
jgi:protein ImuB